MRQHKEHMKIEKYQLGHRPDVQKYLTALCILAMLLTFCGSTLLAQTSGSSASQQVTIEVKPVSKISISGNPGPLVIHRVVSTSNANSVSDENTKYSLITNVDNMKIVASINDRMPLGTRLMMKVTNKRASSTGLVDVSNATIPVDVVTGISKGRDIDQSISYTFAANTEVQEVQAQSRTITLTLTN
jgi:hypothetical protein